MSSTRSKGLMITQGILFIILGLIAIGLPVITSVSLTIFIGAFLLAVGFLLLIQLFQHNATAFWFPLIGALFAIGIGGYMIFYPIHGVVILATLLLVWFISHGLMEILLAFQLKRHNENWGILLLSGVVTLLLAAIIITSWPASSVVILGILFGINLLMYGMAICALGFVLKKNSGVPV
jgi:uncharacterized membrane protein HdeD (DUF308 family)